MESAQSPFFNAFKAHLNNFGRPEQEEKELIRNGPERVRRLDSLARLINKGDSENCVAVALKDKKWYFTANNYAAVKSNLKIIFEGLLQIKKNKNGKVKTKHARRFLLKKYLSNVPKHKTKIRKRLEKDVRKFLSSLKTKAIFTKKEISNLLDPDIPYKKINNKEALHAEVALLSSFASKKVTSCISLGISKLCCKLCAAAIPAFKLDVDFRGRHGNFYYAWTPSSLLLEPQCFEIFVGKKAFLIYKNMKKKDQKETKRILSDLSSHRDFLTSFFSAQRGGVALDSVSAAPRSSHSESSYDEDSTSHSSEEEPYDSSSDS